MISEKPTDGGLVRATDSDHRIRILITRLSHIGDCVLTLPLLTALRRAFPSAFIAWAVESPSDQLLSLHPDLDEIIPIPKNWLTSVKKAWSVRRRLRAGRFDIAIDPQGLTKSSALGWLSGAGQRIGIEGIWGREFSQRLNNRLVKTQSQHIVDRTLELLSELDTDGMPVTFGLPVCKSSAARIDSFLRENGISESCVVINPGASWHSKRWENGRFAVVGKRIHDELGLRSVIAWAGDNELAMAQEIVNRDPQAMVVAPPTSLRDLAALCQGARMFLGCDTGPLHIAAAMGTACVGLYGTTRPQDSGAYGEQHIAIQKRYHGGSSRERRSAGNDAMREIQTDEVFQACQQILERTSPTRAV